MINCIRFMLWCLPGIALSLDVQADDRPAPEPVPYRAYYTLELRPDSASGGGVAALKGHLEARFEQSCDGWSTQQSLGFRMIGADGVGFEHLAYLSAFEDSDARDFTFNSRTWEDRQPLENVAGVASRESRDSAVLVRYSNPQELRASLPAQTIFPGEHVRQVLHAARAGEHTLMHTVFDGSSVDNPVQVATWIGKPRPPRADAEGALAGHTSWPVRLAYFAADTTDPLPQFEMSVVLYDNGIAGDSVYDYGEFEVDVTLKELTLLPVANCH